MQKQYVLLPVGGQYSLGLVVTGQPVDPALNENQAELGILVLSVSLQMLPDSHGLLDEVVEILRQVRGQSLGLEDPQDLVASDKTHLGHTMGIPQNHTNLRRGQTLLGQLEDLLFDIVGCELQPSGNTAPVRQS